MVQVTVTGGTQHANITLQFSADDLAFKEAQKFAAQVTQAYMNKQAVIYDPGVTLVPSSGYVIVPSTVHSKIDVRGFGAVTLDNNTHRDTVFGGGRGVTQTVLGGLGGLDFSAAAGNVTVVSGGGDNRVDFLREHKKDVSATGSDAVYLSGTSSDHNTVIGGMGQTTISAGEGQNKIYTMGGTNDIISSGSDYVKMSVGADTINVMSGGSDTVYGGGMTSTLVFNGGSAASSVFGAQGSITVSGGSGGGFFRGGKAGDNSIIGGSGSVTILGGGAGDTLMGGTGMNDVLRASVGNETLGGGDGSSTFEFYDMKNAGASSQVTDVITNFNSSDIIKLLGKGTHAAINYALNTYQVGAGSSSFSLEDGTKVVLAGYTGPLTHSNFT
jgi:Ca2+-binding RTX toxin-like protein